MYDLIIFIIGAQTVGNHKYIFFSWGRYIWKTDKQMKAWSINNLVNIKHKQIEHR